MFREKIHDKENSVEEISLAQKNTNIPLIDLTIVENIFSRSGLQTAMTCKGSYS